MTCAPGKADRNSPSMSLIAASSGRGDTPIIGARRCRRLGAGERPGSGGHFAPIRQAKECCLPVLLVQICSSCTTSWRTLATGHFGARPETSMSETELAPPGVDPAVPSPARLYDYYLGGTHNFRADRELAEQLRAGIPDMVDAVLANRGFHVRAAAWMAGHGIHQFLDIGSGLPTANNTHETVQALDPAARVVYVCRDSHASTAG